MIIKVMMIFVIIIFITITKVIITFVTALLQHTVFPAETLEMVMQ